MFEPTAVRNGEHQVESDRRAGGDADRGPDGEAGHCENGGPASSRGDTECSGCDRAEPFRGVPAVAFDVADVVDQIRRACCSTESGEVQAQSEERWPCEQRTGGRWRTDDEDVLDPLMRPDGS